jgi:type III restriction enzyme
MELKTFQRKASDKIALRYAEYMKDPLPVKGGIVPFYQNLSAITGSGKTLILADCIEQIRAYSNTQPIILWLSKGKVVVGQTLENLSNGKYTMNIPNYDVLPLLDCKETNLLDDSNALILIATVGKINQKDKESGDRRVFQTGFDKASQSLWNMLKIRENHDKKKRALLIVYDEGHNLSDQQTKLLLELIPDALVAASATTKVPKELEHTISRLQKENALKDDDLITAVSNKDAVDSGLIKKHISIGGYMTPMELAIDTLLSDFCETEEMAKKYCTGFLPKAIYVCDTNMLLETSEVDNHLVSFSDRCARPIRIWKHLVGKGISPSEIAVYCNLKFDKRFPKPDNFRLFSGGDNDYSEFIKEDFRHIIFNKTLQEGWDDPSCYFAYIDKDMGSNTQVTQIIGRVLRQPDATHYPDDRLNTANFYIKTDENDVFKSILEEIEQTLSIDIPEISIKYHISKGGGGNRPTVKPRQVVEIPDIAIDSEQAKPIIGDMISKMMDYNDDTKNIIGEGSTVKITMDIGSKEIGKRTESKTKHSNRVTVRWIFKRELEKLAKNAINLCDIATPKFDALIEYSSNAAAYVREQAALIANAYREYSVIVQNPIDTTEIGDIFVSDKSYEFNHSVHPKYSDFNTFELTFAKALDEIELPWMRNPKNGFLKINLLDGKGSDTFSPDFIVWKDNEILALDTKGNHLIHTDSVRKLFFIENMCFSNEKSYSEKNLVIKLISEKRYNSDKQVIDENGYTVWVLKQGQITPLVCATIKEAVKLCIGGEATL